MRRSKLIAAVLLAAFACSVNGCGQLMGSLRRDLDDSEPLGSPTVGGRFAEQGFLSNSMSEGGPYSDRYDAVGHSERNPAGLRGGDGRVAQSSWVSGEQIENNRRDIGRDVESVDPDRAVSFASNPNMPPPVRRLYKNGNRATRADFVDESPNEASLWASDGQINYYFTKNKIRTVGDIVTVTLDEAFVRDAAAEVKRTLNPAERERELFAAEGRQRQQQFEDQRKARTDGLAASAAAPDRAPATDVGNLPAPEIDVSKSLELKAGDQMLAEIVDRYPNGNYRIRGTKRVAYKNGPPRNLSVVAVVKSTDIGDDDTLNSGKLYEYRLEAGR